MNLAEALGINAAEEFDPARSFRLGPFELGLEAAAEAARILLEGKAAYDVNLSVREFAQPVYWSVDHLTEGQVEIFGFPQSLSSKLPTDLEIGLVRAIAATKLDDHSSIFAGGLEIAIGPAAACKHFREILGSKPPMIGTSVLFAGPTQATIRADIDQLLDKVALRCFVNSFVTSPLKFRFLELYRVMEARFLADVRTKLFASFDTEPNAALNEAQEALKSEMNQIIGLAETQKHAFEACWACLDGIRKSNRFVAALFRRLESKRTHTGAQWQSGATLIYQVRCAIVHAGAKDLIFESFPDGDIALDAIIPYVERAALLLVGIELH